MAGTTAPPDTPRLPSNVVRKLMYFTVAMLSLPLITFFFLRQLGAGPVLSGGSAAGVANIVLIAYVVAAFAEEEPDLLKEKKTQ